MKEEGIVTFDLNGEEGIPVKGLLTALYKRAHPGKGKTYFIEEVQVKYRIMPKKKAIRLYGVG